MSSSRGILDSGEPLDLRSFDDEDHQTGSSISQIASEHNVKLAYESLTQRPTLHSAQHIQFARGGLRALPASAKSLDACKPWLIYWILHSLDILDHELDDGLKRAILSTLRAYQNPDGGFGGGPDQLSHLATTYAAVNALAIVGTAEAYLLLDRTKLLRFFLSLKRQDGSFSMHRGGERDLRGAYCVLSVCSLLNIRSKELVAGIPEFVGSCQGFDGGLGGEPFVESHGGYTFCGVASLFLLGCLSLPSITVDLSLLSQWLLQRQLPFSGGFSGRTNKVVDSCYSFWISAAILVLSQATAPAFGGSDRGKTAGLSKGFNAAALRDYLLGCCQDDLRGGMKDKPACTADYYHTCYALSGLSLALHDQGTARGAGANLEDLIISDREVKAVDPVHNLTFPRIAGMRAFFGSSKLPDVGDR